MGFPYENRVRVGHRSKSIELKYVHGGYEDSGEVLLTYDHSAGFLEEAGSLQWRVTVTRLSGALWLRVYVEDVEKYSSAFYVLNGVEEQAFIRLIAEPMLESALEESAKAYDAPPLEELSGVWRCGYCLSLNSKPSRYGPRPRCRDYRCEMDMLPALRMLVARASRGNEPLLEVSVRRAKRLLGDCDGNLEAAGRIGKPYGQLFVKGHGRGR